MTKQQLKFRCYELSRGLEFRTDIEREVIKNYCVLAAKYLFNSNKYYGLDAAIKRLEFLKDLGV